jgi:hypothetical protein
MLPREHGAYAELALPIAAALGASRPTLASACMAVAACAAFVAHEPALVLLGHRGRRAQREATPEARRWLAGALAAAALLGATALTRCPDARAWALLPLALTIATAALVTAKRERTLAGELVVCATLASAAVPTALAQGIGWREALASWGAFCAAFGVSTVEVRALAQRDVRRRTRAVAWLAAIAILGALAAVRPLLALASLPVLVVVLVVLLPARSAAALRRLGWTLATSSLAMSVAVAVALRAGR